jgi:hypothetical protein
MPHTTSNILANFKVNISAVIYCKFFLNIRIVQINGYVLQ